MPLYTPFFEKGMQKLGEGYGTMRRNQFVQDAYMGDKDALGNLYRVDPDTALAIEERQKKEEATRLLAAETARQRQRTESREDLQLGMEVDNFERGQVEDRQQDEDRLVEIYRSNKDRIDPLLEKAPQFENFEDFEAYVAGSVEGDIELQQLAEQLTPEFFEQAKTAYGTDEGFWETVYDGDQNIIAQRNRKNGEVKADPRTAQDIDAFEMVKNGDGITVAQRNKQTGEIKSVPSALSGEDEWESILDADNNVIAQQNQSTGEVKSDPRAADEKGTWEEVFDEKGNPVALRNSVTFDMKSHPQEESAQNQRQQRINSTTSMLGNSVENPEEFATKIVDGLIDYNISEDGSTARFIDMTKFATDPDNAVRDIPIANLTLFGEQERPEAPMKIWDVTDEIAGFAPFTEEVWGKSVGQVFPGAVSDQTDQARQFVRSQKEQLINALRQSPRFTEAEATRIAEDINIAPAVFDSPGSLRNRLRSIDGTLRLKMDQEEIIARSDDMPEEERSAARNIVGNIQNFLDVLGVPPELKAADFEVTTDIENLDPADIRRFFRDASDDELRALSDEAEAKVREILDG